MPPPSPEIVRAEQRVADAEAEFDAAVAAGRPLPVLTTREHELLLARAALDAARAITSFPERVVRDATVESSSTPVAGSADRDVAH